MNSNDINVLGNILETSWGKSSQDYNCTYRMEGNILRLMYSSIVYLASEKSMNSQIPEASNHANERVKARISSAKKEFQKETGESLNLKEVRNQDDVQYVQASSLSPRKVVVFRKFVDFEIK